jgi:prepilin-type N-terminal cleavage/methylation domain-containing protein
MKNQAGFTLVELMVVVSITVLLLSWGIPSFSTWNVKHGVENQMVQLYSDLQFGRMTGYGSKVVAGVWWGTGAGITSQTGGYQIRYDNSNPVANSIDGPAAFVQVGNTVLPKYPITVSANQNSVSFDGRGFLNSANPLDPANPITFSVSSTSGAAIDCVAVSTTRITLGKMSAGTCQPK